jgi:hypothetical protein
MKQRQMIMAVVVVGVVAAALWVWRENSTQPEVAMAPAKVAPMQDAFHQSSSAPAAVSESAPAAAPSPPPAPAPAAAPEVDQAAVKAQAEPQSVDTPEPADRKFARGGRADESDQNQN